jgi:AraC-like DNA-binding protein
VAADVAKLYASYFDIPYQRVEHRMGENTLHRRLQDLEVSYTALLDAARKEHACQAVAHTQRAFADIAQSLGFAEASTFNRAFKRWTRRAPGDYRRIGGSDV